MQPVTVVVSLPVADLDRSLRFYRDGLQIPPVDAGDSIVTFELPNLSLFLIEYDEYSRYLDRSSAPAPQIPAAGACIISCAIATRAEIDEILERAVAAGGTARPAEDFDGSHTGYISDPDGHLWELVANEHTATSSAR